MSVQKSYSFLFLIGFLLLLIVQEQVYGRGINKSQSKEKSETLTEDDARAYLDTLDPEYQIEGNKQMTARWNYLTDVTDENDRLSNEATIAFENYKASIQLHLKDTFPDWETYNDPVKREIKYLRLNGPGLLPAEEVEEMNRILSAMERAYATVTVCEYNNDQKCDLYLEDIEAKIASVVDFDELAYYWNAWHDAISTHEDISSTIYKTFMDFQNQIAQSLDLNDMSEIWLSQYDDGIDGWTAVQFKEDLKGIWSDLKPTYEKLHAYVRMKLRPLYDGKISKYGYLPANLMGNIWAQDWGNLNGRTRPYPDEADLNPTEAMLKKNYTVAKMFEVSDEFFISMDLLQMPPKFWELSMFERPLDREVICHASAEDFFLDQDFRTKMCTTVDSDMLITVHHELGHIEYFDQYKDNHFIFRNGANPGFHEAIGDALALAVMTPKHLKCVLELDIEVDIICPDPENPDKSKKNTKEVTPMDINFLYYMALQKFAFFPFAISMDSWRWEIFEGLLQPEDYNKRWWELRIDNQGIMPPSGLRPDDVFDAAAKYHIVANVEYGRYFVSHILQFQFYEAMCILAGQYDPNDPLSDPLYQCDFAGSVEAGSKLGEMMKLGLSKPWPEALEILTGSGEMNVQSLLNYFQPLFEYIDGELTKENEAACFGICEDEARNYLENIYEPEASALMKEYALAEWGYQTDINNETAQEHLTNASLAWADFTYKQWDQTIKHIDFSEFQDESIKRLLTILNDIGTAALSTEDLTQYNNVLNEMGTIYSSGKICPYDKIDTCDLATEGWSLNPDLEDIVGSSNDSDVLKYVWEGWRDVSGKAIRDKGLYDNYLDLSNKAAVANGYDNMGDFWLKGYESETIREEFDQAWKDVEELYKNLHAYVRFRLKEAYGDIVKDNEPIPEHLLGNMWAQQWNNIYSMVLPYKDAAVFDVTQALKEKYTEDLEGVVGMVEVANDFFVQSGLEDMAMSYGEKSILIRPEDREIVCHASAWDFSDKEDFRVKMCTKVNMEDFITIHHELGHIQYYLQYKDLSFREGANDGFHEAVGDVVSLSVATPKHMRQIGLLPPDEGGDDEEQRQSMINYLMKMALDKIAFLPFGYLIDSYRWKIFDGSIPRDKVNYHWLKMREEFQGIIPPVMRHENDFDAGSKYHVPANVPYIRYFTSFILQFQLHKYLCKEAGEIGGDEDPLHDCDIYANPAAGLKFKEILAAGASENWKTLLLRITGEDRLNASAIVHYFKPLSDFFEEQKETHGYETGWRNGAFEDVYEEFEPITTTEPITDTTTEPITDTTTEPITDTTTEPITDTTTEPITETTTEPVTETTTSNPPDYSEEEARNYLENIYEPEASALMKEYALAEWGYQTDINNETAQEHLTNASLAWADFTYKQWDQTIKHFNYSEFQDSKIKRLLTILNDIGTAALSTEDLTQYNNVLNEMGTIYSSGKICPYDKIDACNLETEGWSLNPALEDIVGSSNNSEELKYAWKGWRDVSGKIIREKGLYDNYLDLSNKAAVANGFDNMGDFWLKGYESETMREEFEQAWKDVEELYKNLHAYVRYRLKEAYGDIVKDNEPIPEHLLGNMWAQQWNNIYSKVLPYKDAAVFDVTQALKDKYTEDLEGVIGMFEVANDFFVQSGLEDMAMSYGDKAILIRPEDRDIVCHASAWDFSDKEDFRVKMCTKVNMEDFITIHHELGHIQYFLQYKDLPLSFREGANDGFHEAVGDVVSLSVATPKHMRQIGLLPPDEGGDDEEQRQSMINYLMKMALDKIAFLPFGYLIDSYRWKIFDGSIPRDKVNYHWLKMREEFQGIIPPVMRNENDFDAGSKYHVPANVPYIRYFTSFILQFQIHKFLCKEAGEIDGDEDPLHDCDIYANPAAGLKFKEILASGASENWKSLLLRITGEDRLNASAIVHYFKPLSDFFEEQKETHGYETGWRNGAFEDVYEEFESEEEKGTNTAAIVVGIILGVAVLVIVVGYFVGKKLRRK